MSKPEVINQPIGYEIGEFVGGKWVGFADCTPCLMPRKEAELWLDNLKAGQGRSPDAEYRLVGVHPA